MTDDRTPADPLLAFSRRERVLARGLLYFGVGAVIGAAVRWPWWWLWNQHDLGRLSFNDVVTASLQFASIVVTATAGGIALWVGYLTWHLVQGARRQVAEMRAQLLNTREQLALAREDQADAARERFRRNKPIVLTDVDSSGRYVLRNVGGGPALNVYWLPSSSHDTKALPLGGLGVGEERPLPDVAVIDIAEGSYWSHMLIAEGIRTRTRRWSATLNCGFCFTNAPIVVHDLFDHGPGSHMWDDRHLTVDEYLHRWRSDLQTSLANLLNREIGWLRMAGSDAMKQRSERKP